jgi:hypothetical protein
MTPTEAGIAVVADWAPPTGEQLEEAARIIAADIRDRMGRAA